MIPLSGRPRRSCGAASGAVALEEEHARGGAAPGADDCGGSVGDLPLTGIVAQLRNGLVEEPEPVQPPLRELSPVGVEGELPSGAMRLPPSSQSWASPRPQNPRASSHEMALNVNPS